MHSGRYVDVLLSLYSTRNDKPCLGRLQLQKFIYLCDSISLVWQQAALGTGYKTYKHGPYDPRIQNAIDSLAFRGYARITSSDTSKPKEVSAFYEITQFGISIVEQIEPKAPFSQRLSLCEQVSNAITERGWDNLLSLVYSEPTYVQEGARGWGRYIKMNSTLSNASLRVLESFMGLTREGRISNANITAIFFEILDHILANNEPGYGKS